MREDLSGSLFDHRLVLVTGLFIMHTLCARRRTPDRLLVLGLLSLLALAPVGCANGNYLKVRKVPQNPLAGSLQLWSRSGPQPTPRTEQLLRRFDLVETQKRDEHQAIQRLQEVVATEPSTESMYAIAELAYISGKRAQARGDEATAKNMFSAAVAHTYMYLFAPQFDQMRNPYDPQFRRACDLYNSALEDVLRIVNKNNHLHPGDTYTLEAGKKRFDVHVALRGPWRDEHIERIEFVSDYTVEGLVNVHRTYGLGVPLIAVRKKQPGRDPASRFYPQSMSFPITAILRASERPCESPDDQQVVTCVLELHDPLAGDVVQVAGRPVPLETDLTTPLGYFLDHPSFNPKQLATWGLLNPGSANELRGLYMLEAFDPHKIPVLLVHGLWSSPETWTEMFNDLRSMPEIRQRYQFWTYLYPTGQPFWISAAQLRYDLENTRQTIDPQRQCGALDQMVLVGHSMGGLVSRLQTLESGDDYWHIISHKPFDQLNADEETREKLQRALFFEPNSSIRRVVTIGTPHRGSEFANDYTRWLGRKVIRLPKMLMATTTKLVRDNPDFFTNTDVLTMNTSIDSLSPNSPILPVMLQSRTSPRTKYHNIVGVISDRDLLGRITETGDGVVPYKSAHLDDVDSEIVVEADHIHVHQHPRSILEVRRILLDHSIDVYAEMSQPPMTLPAGYQSSLAPRNNRPLGPE
jgi:pimeloyl-ACP methyl ester carboxylesterase